MTQEGPENDPETKKPRIARLFFSLSSALLGELASQPKQG